MTQTLNKYFYNESRRTVFSDNIQYIGMADEYLYVKENCSGKNFEIISNTKKILIYFHESYYHFICDQIVTLLEILKKDILKNNIDCQIIIASSLTFSLNNSPTYIDYLIKKIEEYGFNYLIICKNDYDTITIDNFYMHDFSMSLFNEENIKDLENFFNLNNNDGTKKVYVSRKYLEKRDFEERKILENKNFFQQQIGPRIKNEKILENYFKKYNFEIVYPEDFKSFEDQIEYFKDVSFMISSTSSGLTNQIFMPRNKIVIELTTVMNSAGKDPTLGIHHFYSILAYYKNHTYIGIPNYSREANDIINLIENNSKLKDLLKNG